MKCGRLRGGWANKKQTTGNKFGETGEKKKRIYMYIEIQEIRARCGNNSNCHNVHTTSDSRKKQRFVSRRFAFAKPLLPPPLPSELWDKCLGIKGKDIFYRENGTVF
eukprot:GEMP01014267.1.p2 GENE.GEMP01014267.1~~GEMP01014267.1.p2  ORF type:complete len:107 (-),score=4.12 GEMP01014267.1:726-1046(-)